MKFTLFGYSFLLSIADKRSGVWWKNTTRKEDSPSQRADLLFGIQRVWSRDNRVYLYKIVCGRYCLMIASLKQKYVPSNKTEESKLATTAHFIKHELEMLKYNADKTGKPYIVHGSVSIKKIVKNGRIETNEVE